jgi:16S rRNA G527 N7-methylase RsmG
METPYLDTLKANLENQINLLSHLEKRIEYLNAEIENCPSEHYHINEARINIIKTNSEIDTLRNIIKEKSDYYEKFAANFEYEFAEMQKNYSKIMESAYLRAAKIPTLKKFLTNVNKKLIESDKEAKLYFYKKVKDYMQ